MRSQLPLEMELTRFPLRTLDDLPILLQVNRPRGFLPFLVLDVEQKDPVGLLDGGLLLVGGHLGERVGEGLVGFARGGRETTSARLSSFPRQFEWRGRRGNTNREDRRSVEALFLESPRSKRRSG